MDSTIHTISNVAVIPSVLVVSGRGPCKIEENFTDLSNYLGLQIDDVKFYIQCAGPNSVTITKSTSLTKNAHSHKKNVKRDFFEDSRRRHKEFIEKAENDAKKFQEQAEEDWKLQIDKFNNFNKINNFQGNLDFKIKKSI